MNRKELIYKINQHLDNLNYFFKATYDFKFSDKELEVIEKELNKLITKSENIVFYNDYEFKDKEV